MACSVLGYLCLAQTMRVPHHRSQTSEDIRITWGAYLRCTSQNYETSLKKKVYCTLSLGHTLRNCPELLCLHPPLECYHLEVRACDFFLFVAPATSPGPSQGLDRHSLSGAAPQNRKKPILRAQSGKQKPHWVFQQREFNMRNSLNRC